MPAEALKRKIKTTNDLRDIVSNMKMLSSVSILQYEQANKVLERYQRNLRDAFQVLAINNGIPNFNDKKNSDGKCLFILIGSDNGMVGRFNKEITEAAKKYQKENNFAAEDVSCITLGKRLSVIAEQSRLKIVCGYAMPNAVKTVTLLAEAVILKMDEAMRREGINKVVVFYHRRKEHSGVELKIRKLFPTDKNIIKNTIAKRWETNNIPMLPIDKHKMFAALINEILMIALSKEINSSLAAEHFTRMTNMQNAESNIDEKLEEMNLKYQQQRQEEITDELIDVISGSEAVNRKK
ncbi:MAG: F0F1 ATP synthase subunit gamma [Alphaproteobacteria bacterium]|nr:F0F1 ATP synthase subunit gamma [Alphaproteobacteria bacterium]